MRRSLLAVVLLAVIPTPVQARYLHVERARLAALHGAQFFRGSDADRVVVSTCRHGQPASKLVYCHVTESGPAIDALGWATMDYSIAVLLSRHRDRLAVIGGYTVNWYEPLRTGPSRILA